MNLIFLLQLDGVIFNGILPTLGIIFLLINGYCLFNYYSSKKKKESKETIRYRLPSIYVRNEVVINTTPPTSQIPFCLRYFFLYCKNKENK